MKAKFVFVPGGGDRSQIRGTNECPNMHLVIFSMEKKQSGGYGSKAKTTFEGADAGAICLPALKGNN